MWVHRAASEAEAKSWIEVLRASIKYWASRSVRSAPFSVVLFIVVNLCHSFYSVLLCALRQACTPYSHSISSYCAQVNVQASGPAAAGVVAAGSGAAAAVVTIGEYGVGAGAPAEAGAAAGAAVRVGTS